MPCRRRTATTPLLALCVLLSAGCGADERPDASAGASTTPPAPSAPSGADASFPDPQPADVLGRVEVGGAACGVIVAAGRVWVSSLTDGTLVSVDPRTMKVQTRTEVGDKPCGLASGAGSVWVENYGSYDVTRVDARTGKSQATYNVGYSPYDVTFADGAAWVTNNGSRSLSRIDAATGKVTTVRTGGHPVGITSAAGRVWAALGDGGIVSIDPTTSRIEDRIRTEEQSGWTAAGGSTVWVTVANALDEIDARTGAVTRTVPLPERPADGSSLGDTVYIPHRRTGLVSVVRDGTVVDLVDTGLRDPFVLAAQGNDLWLADFGGDSLVRIRAPR